MGITVWSILIPRWYRRTRIAISIACVLLGVVAFTNFGRFHGYGVVHKHDFFHYYIGSKYFPELRYDLIYRCTVVALANTAPELTTVRQKDLLTYRYRQFHNERDAEICESRFSRYRWLLFTTDLEWFYRALGAERLKRLVSDHGYNPPPFWTAIWSKISTKVPPWTMEKWVPYIDLIFVLLSAFLVFLLLEFELFLSWCAVILLMPFSSFQWIGGGFARWDWFFLMHIGLYMLFKKRHTLSMMFLSLAAGLRIFPGLIIPGLLTFITKSTTKDSNRQITGLILGVILILAFTHIPEWIEFLEHLKNFGKARPSNFIGLMILERKYAAIPRVLLQCLFYGWMLWYVYMAYKIKQKVSFVVLPGLFLLLPLSNYYYIVLAILAVMAGKDKRYSMVIWLMIALGWFAEDPHRASVSSSAYWTLLFIGGFSVLIMFEYNRAKTSLLDLDRSTCGEKN